MDSIETGTTRTTRVIGRDACAAAREARDQGTTTPLAVNGQVIAAIIPAGRGSLTERELSETVARLLAQLRSTAYKPDATVSDAQVLGLLIARYLGDANAIYETAAAALEDSNFHAEAAHLRTLGGLS